MAKSKRVDTSTSVSGAPPPHTVELFGVRFMAFIDLKGVSQWELQTSF